MVVPRGRQGVDLWCGLAGQRTASGERYDPKKLTAAHAACRSGAEVTVVALETGRQVEVRITDRGPFTHGREIDLSLRAAEKLGIVDKGVAEVRITATRNSSQARRDRRASGGTWRRLALLSQVTRSSRGEGHVTGLRHHRPGRPRELSRLSGSPPPASDLAPADATRSMPKLAAAGTGASIPVLVAGTFAVNCYTGINRATKDLDIFCKAGDFPRILLHFKDQGFDDRDRGRALDREGPARRLLLRRDLRLGHRGGHGHRSLVPGKSSGRALRRDGPADPADRDDLVEGAAAEPASL